MSTDDLVDYVTDDVTEHYKGLSDKEFLRQAEDYWDESYPEIVEEIKEI